RAVGRAAMIYPYNNATQTQWNHGDFKVQLLPPTTTRPMGFCDGTDEDVAELNAIADSEGAEAFAIHNKFLKTGREI
ncbi:MAG: hypothetical protein ACI9MR_001374, partial [Myxococcota bacterium]